jgi:hypothetical protein
MSTNNRPYYIQAKGPEGQEFEFEYDAPSRKVALDLFQKQYGDRGWRVGSVQSLRSALLGYAAIGAMVTALAVGTYNKLQSPEQPTTVPVTTTQQAE